MSDLHWTFIGAAYGLTAAAIIAEVVALMQRRRRAIARVLSERENDEHGEHEGNDGHHGHDRDNNIDRGD
jgi:hypothetical protein